MGERWGTSWLVGLAVVGIAPFLTPRTALGLPGCCLRTFSIGTNCIVSENTSQALCESICNPSGTPPCLSAKADVCDEGTALLACSNDGNCEATCATFTPTPTSTPTPTVTPTNTPLSNGSRCQDPGQCMSGYCVDDVCCADPSCPLGQSCDNPPSPGVCTANSTAAAPAVSPGGGLLLALLLGIAGIAVLRRGYAR